MGKNCDFISTCLQIGAIKFGHYLMKQGVYSPVYVDLRSSISFPYFVKQLAEEIWTKKQEMKIEADVICGVPYTALPIATALGVLYDVPMVLRRKEAKSYGTKKIIEGTFKKGDKCLIIEDVVVSGGSILETASILRKEGLVVSDSIVILDREQGAPENLKKEGITLHSLYKLKNILTDMLNLELAPADTIRKALMYLENTSFPDNRNPTYKTISFARRAEVCSHPTLRKLCNIIEEKKTNLCVAVDVVKSSELLLLAENLGPHVCMLKTHMDILENFSSHVPKSLQKIAEKHNFLIMEDRKFADIGSTVQKQFKGGMYKISDWADIVTVHSIPGDGVVEGLKAACKEKACILIAQMSAKDGITTAEYIARTVKIAENHKDFVIGFISQSQISDSPDFIHICPGVNLNAVEDDLGQKYKTPEEAIEENGVTIVVVGRGITRSKNIIESALLYKNEAYQAYIRTIMK